MAVMLTSATKLLQMLIPLLTLALEALSSGGAIQKSLL